MLLLLLLLLILLLLSSFTGYHCKFYNDGCSSDAECCSGRCMQKHEGTNFRCTPSALHQPCVYDYHCSDGLECCEKTYNCCSPIWKDCMYSVDCCDPEHKCIHVKGFTYKRCLVSATADVIHSTSLPIFSSLVASCFVFLITFLRMPLHSSANVNERRKPSAGHYNRWSC
uniref:Granulins domain-containing protein n=1 Tax=Octopus bimaculoides TaxID=37653 RepID=A0A0L8FII8_OCTBM|eukprot:XP_014789719.1 PREDICTED: uncharacterized protein LOC106883278 [Octopus bimaculoides]